jgi:hypothetical protein
MIAKTLWSRKGATVDRNSKTQAFKLLRRLASVIQLNAKPEGIHFNLQRPRTTGCVSAAARCLIETTSTIMPERRKVRSEISRLLQTRVVRGPIRRG